MPENDYELEHKEAQSVNAQTWQDMGNSEDTPNTNQTNNLALVSENIPQLSKEEQTVLEEKRNDPEFQKGLNKILPTGNGNKEDTNAKNVNLSDLIKQWQNENKDSDKDNSKESPKENKTGLPDELKSGMEALSGINLDDIKVYYNSSLPAEYNALAYAQGTDIHIGPGQKQHLAHEAWHVVQQKQGLVKATMEMKDGVGVNDDDGLEKEADVMGKKALETTKTTNNNAIEEKIGTQNSPIQRVIWVKKDNTWGTTDANPTNSPPAKHFGENGNFYDDELDKLYTADEYKNRGKRKEVMPFPYLKNFAYDLPLNLGRLFWIKSPEYFTANGWMSENIHLSKDQSEDLGSPNLLSLHAIIAIKDMGNTIRINPHVTVRDQKHQKDRDDREKARINENGQQQVKDAEAKNLDKQDALYSNQVGLKSLRTEKEGQENKLKTSDLNLIFTEDWLIGMVLAAGAYADPSKKYEVGTATAEFKTKK